jgi:hypothetical protein
VLIGDYLGMSEYPTDLTAWEQQFVSAVVAGAVLECSQELVGSTDLACTIRAEVLRKLLLGGFKAPLDPRGIRLRGACITGTLDLTHVRASVGMELRDCKIVKPLLLEHAHLPWLTLTGSSAPALDGDNLRVDSAMSLRGLRVCGRGGVNLWDARIGGPLSLSDSELINEDGPALDGDGLRVDSSMFMRGIRVSGHGERGAVNLRDAQISGQLNLSDAELTNDDGPALNGDGLRVHSSIFLSRARVSGRGRRGAVNLRRAQIGDLLDLSDAELTNKDGPALESNVLQVNSSMFLRKGFRASGRGQYGAVGLRGARIGGQLDLSGAELINEDGPALDGDALEVGSLMLLREGFRASGRGDRGAVILRGARIGGHLEIDGAELINENGPALMGNTLQVNASMFLRDDFRASGRGPDGAVNLRGARIGGVLDLSGGELINEHGPALDGDNLEVDSSMVLKDGFRASGHSGRGAVDLRGARIGGQLDLSGAELINGDGPALHGDALQVNASMFLRDGFRASGCGPGGAVNLWGARIGGQLNLRGAELINEDGPALHGERLQVSVSMVLAEGFRASGCGKRGAVILQGAQIDGGLDLRGAKLTNRDGFVLDLQAAEVKHFFLSSDVVCPQELGGRLKCKTLFRSVGVSGFVYTSLHDISWNQWLHLIVCHTRHYSAQPYQQLAAVRRALGHEGDARWILIAQQQDIRECGVLGGWLATTAHRLWGALAGYGYRTRRTALALLVVLLVAGGLGVAAGHTPISTGRYVAAHTSKVNNPGSPCSLLEQIGVGIDRGLPLSSTGIRDSCDFDTTSRRGQAITAATWVLQALVWALATLVVVGYTGLIRKPI